jgi:hypothetical protein
MIGVEWVKRLSGTAYCKWWSLTLLVAKITLTKSQPELLTFIQTVLYPKSAKDIAERLKYEENLDTGNTKNWLDYINFELKEKK